MDGPQHLVLRVMKEGAELAEETLTPFARELVVESPETRQKECGEGVNCCVWGKPVEGFV